MSNSLRLSGILLLTTALSAPIAAHAQQSASGAVDSPPSGEAIADPAPAATPPVEPGQSTPPADEPVEVSVPGEIVVTGQRDRNISKMSDQVVSVLSTADIARTGEGNIAGALGRVTGLSVVGSGFVYVRGLGDRYSLALLNGSPLPSPEPLKRVVPLDLFPSSVIASSLVQKSYSVNYPGEFGGGVINLTTKSVPREDFITIGAGISGDNETTGQRGYTYYGSKSDWTGFDNGQRDYPSALKAFFASGARLSSGTVDSQAIASQLVTSRNAVLQGWNHLPPNFSASFSAGKAQTFGEVEVGLIAAAGYSNKWSNRGVHSQTSLSADVSSVESDFYRVVTDNRIVLNGLIGLGAKFGGNNLRWTTVYIRDTDKNARLGLGNRGGTKVDFSQQDTAWYERQLLDTQLVGEFELAPGLRLDARGGYANSQREAPFELSLEYVRSNSPSDPYGAYFVNRLNNGNGGDAGITFSDLTEKLYSGGLDLTYVLQPGINLTVGGAYSNTDRVSSRRDFQFTAPASFPTAVGLFRPDYLLQPSVINFYKIALIETDEGNPAFDARLENWAGYVKATADVTDQLSIDAGVRYEKATQTVDPIQVFTTPGAGTGGTALDNAYWLPAATVTYKARPDLQLRVSGSKTIARPQFRELINQPYFDPDSNRSYRGNPLLQDSQLYNAEARAEWYFATDQRLSVAGFWKKIDHPIEAFVNGSDFITSYANAPTAQLYGAELEAQKYFDLNDWGGWFTGRRVVTVANYTFTKSKLKVSADDAVRVFGAASTIATDYFRNGAPLTGQSDHLVNLELGLENTDHLSQQTVLLTYASDRVVSRGIASIAQPDIIERPGLRVDFVAREGYDLWGKELEIKLEARNLTGQKHNEFQRSGSNRIDTNVYDVGQSFSLSASLKF